MADFIIRTGNDWPQVIPSSGGAISNGIPIYSNAIAVGVAQILNFQGNAAVVTIDGGDPNQINVGISVDFRNHVRASGIWTTGAVAGLAVFGGVTPVDGDRMLIISNISPDPVAVGIFIAHAGPWTRPTDFESGSNAEGTLVEAVDGTAAGTVYKCETLGPNDVVDTDPLVFSVLVLALTQSGGFTLAVDQVTQTGTAFASDTVEFRQFGFSSFLARVDFVVTAGGAGFNFFCPTLGSVANNSAQLGIPDGNLMWGDSTVRIYGTLQENVPFSATPNFDPFDGQYQTLTLTATLTGWTLTNGGGTPHGASPIEGQTITIAFIQDGVGGWGTGTAPANVRFAGGAMTAPSGAAGSISLYTFRWDTALAFWLEQNPPAIGV